MNQLTLHHFLVLHMLILFIYIIPCERFFLAQTVCESYRIFENSKKRQQIGIPETSFSTIRKEKKKLAYEFSLKIVVEVIIEVFIVIVVQVSKFHWLVSQSDPFRF